jgi:hypothetical protein
LYVGADYLITLDKRLADRISQEEERSLPALSPGVFITEHRATHPAYRSIRSE